MVTFEKKQMGDGSMHVTISGKIDENFDGAPIVATLSGTRVVMHLAGVRSISSLGVRAFENFIASIGKREVILIHVSAAIASQFTMIPTLCGGIKIESAKLPFICPTCGSEKQHTVPFALNANVAHAPKCDCGAAMELDGLPEQYLPS